MNDERPLEHIDPLARGALRHEVVRRLLRAIFQGEMPAGTRLVAKRLAERLGVSATPIREALVELEQVGMVELFHNRGALVKPLGREQLRGIYHVRRVLEAEAALCAASRVDRDKIREIRRTMERLIATVPNGDGSWYAEMNAADRELHAHVVDRCNNPRLGDEIRRYEILAQTTRDIIGNHHAIYMQIAQDHLPLLEALLDGRSEDAGMLMARHLDNLGAAAEQVMFPVSDNGA